MLFRSPDFYENFYIKDNPGEEYLSNDKQFYRLTNNIDEGFKDRITHYILGKYNIDKSYTDIRSLVGKYSSSDIFAKQQQFDNQQALKIIAESQGKTSEEYELDKVIAIAETQLKAEKNIKDAEDGHL